MVDFMDLKVKFYLAHLSKILYIEKRILHTEGKNTITIQHSASHACDIVWFCCSKFNLTQQNTIILFLS